MRLFPATIFVLVLGGIAFPFSCAGLLLILTLTHEKGYKICANGQTRSAVCTLHLIVQAYLRIIIPQDEDALLAETQNGGLINIRVIVSP